MTEIETSCACTRAEEFDFANPEAARRSYRLAAWLVDRHTCDHVAVSDLLPRDCQGCAIFFSNCFDADIGRSKCHRKSDDNLLLFALRPVNAAKFTRTVTTSIIVMSAPAHALSIEGADETNDKCSLQAGSEVLRPYFREFTRNQYWSKKIPVHVRRMFESVTATINVRFEVEHGTDVSQRAITLDVSIPPEQQTDSSSDEDLVQIKEQNVSDLVTIAIVTECVKILLKEGWDFLKKYPLGSDSNEIVTLNIASEPVTLMSATPERIGNLVEKAVRHWHTDPTPVLIGLKRRMEDLVNEKGHLIADKGDSLNVMETGRVKSRIDRIDREIRDTGEEIWKTLQSTGQFEVLRTAA